MPLSWTKAVEGTSGPQGLERKGRYALLLLYGQVARSTHRKLAGRIQQFSVDGEFLSREELDTEKRKRVIL
jgi:hypothetical protein